MFRGMQGGMNMFLRRRRRELRYRVRNLILTLLLQGEDRGYFGRTDCLSLVQKVRVLILDLHVIGTSHFHYQTLISRKGGPLTVTDANLFLGRLLPEFFPKIFGEKEGEGLGEKASGKLFQELTEIIN